MPNGALTPLLRYLRKITAPEDSGETTDRQLLARFILHRDEAAFADLVQRHGPMVMGVCRRVLGDWHEAEDAFQATFLVLARKGASVRKPELLANWLYGVAFRTALKARGIMAKRRARVHPLMELPGSPSGEKGMSELGPILDEELQRLPAKYRTPVVLCYFEGKSHEEIARQLGCPRETVSTRMARARERLRKRLVRRGVTLTSAALAAALSEQAASASVTPALAEATVKAAVLFVVAEASVAGTVSTQVIALTQGVIKAMMISKLMNAVLVVMALAVIGAGTGLVWQSVAAGYSQEADSKTAANDNKKGQDTKRKEEKEKVASPEGKITAEQRAKQWREKLDTPTAFDVDPNTPLKEVLAFIAERYGITILIDARAFVTEASSQEDPPQDIGSFPITIPKLVDVKLSTILRTVLVQVDGDYYTKDDVLMVVPRKQIESGRLFRQPVDAVYKKRQLVLALEELQNMTGVSIVLDVRLQDIAKPMEITADFRNVPLETAVRVLADMADLKSVVMDNLIYVTSKENAKVLEAEENKRKGTKPETRKDEKAPSKEKKPPAEKPAAPSP
jgi:RNA polymerase sigma factor (sigma-70 family)